MNATNSLRTPAFPSQAPRDLGSDPAASQRGLQWQILFQVAICLAPAMVLLRMGSYAASGRVFFAVFGLVLARVLIRQNPAEVTCLIAACLPAMMLLRDFFYYSSVEFLLALSVGYWAFYAREHFLDLFRSRIVQGLLVFITIYWLASFVFTGDYSSNLRVFELSFSAMGIGLLSRYRNYLATALIGVALSGISMGLAVIGQGERLGMVRTDDTRLGNPVTFGLPMALILVLCLAEQGRWLGLERNPVIRTALAVTVGIFLLLSTSRGSWSVASTCTIALLLFSRHRFQVLTYVLLAGAAVGSWIHFAEPAAVEKYFDKTFFSDEEWGVTNARVTQWETFPTAFADAPLFGFGPGSGKGVSNRYSGHNLIWHSLYLHMGIEGGSVGLLLLAIFLISLIANGFSRLRKSGEIAPLLGVIGFMTIAISIPAIDGAAGMFLGLSLAGGSQQRYRIIRVLTSPSKRRRVLNVSRQEQ